MALHDRAQPLLARPQRLLGALTLGDVAQVGDEEALPLDRRGGQGQLDRERRAIGAQARGLGAAAEQSDLAGGHHASHSGRMRGAQVQRHHHLGQRAPDHLLTPVAEDALGRGTELPHHTPLVRDDDRIERRLDHGAGQRIPAGGRHRLDLPADRRLDGKGSGAEHVPGTANRLDHRRALGVRLDLAPQPPDLGVDAAVEGVEFPVMCKLRQLLPAQRPVRIGGEGTEKLELRRRDRYLLPILERVQRAGVEVQHAAPEADSTASGLGRGWARRPDALEHVAHPRQQLARLERLRQIVVSTHLEPNDAIEGIAGGRQHDDPGVLMLPQPAGQAEPVLAGHTDIKNDEVDRLPGQSGPHRRATVRRFDVEPVQRQVLADHLADPVLVVDTRTRPPSGICPLPRPNLESPGHLVRPAGTSMPETSDPEDEAPTSTFASHYDFYGGKLLLEPRATCSYTVTGSHCPAYLGAVACGAAKVAYGESAVLHSVGEPVPSPALAPLLAVAALWQKPAAFKDTTTAALLGRAGVGSPSIMARLPARQLCAVWKV